MTTNDDLDAFLAKMDGDGTAYAVDNYRTLLTGTLRTQADTLAVHLTDFERAIEQEAEKRGLTVPWG